MYYVIETGTPLLEALASFPAGFSVAKAARLYAERMKAANGKNYDVVLVETVTTTQTLEETLKGE